MLAWINRFFVGGPFQGLSLSESSFIRSIYVLSHPLVIASTVAYFLMGTHPDLAPSIAIWGDDYADFAIRYAEAGNSPQVFIAFFSIYPVTALATLFTIIPRLIISEQKYWRSRWVTKTIYWRLGILVWLVLIGIVSLFGMFVPSDPSFCSGCTRRSYIGLITIYGVGLPIGFALVIAGTIVITASFFNGLNSEVIGEYHG